MRTEPSTLTRTGRQKHRNRTQDELLRYEAELQKQADGALTQELGEGSGVVDGKEVELALRIEASIQYQGMEMRVES